MKPIKSIDEELSNLGIRKTNECEFGAFYEKYDPTYGIMHKIIIVLLPNSGGIITSYRGDINDEKRSCPVALTYEEIRLFEKKMRQLIIKYNPSYKLADKDTVEVNRDKLIELLSRYFSIGDSDTYELTRVKEAFAVGTMTFDDFVEWNEDNVADLADWLIKELNEDENDER